MRVTGIGVKPRPVPEALGSSLAPCLSLGFFINWFVKGRYRIYPFYSLGRLT